MLLSGMRAGDESVQPLDPMRKPVCHQEIQRPIGRRRLGAFPQDLKDLIGPKRAVPFQQNLKHTPPRGRKLQPGLAAMAVRRRHPGGNAMLVVVSFKSDHSGLICYTITNIKRLAQTNGVFMRYAILFCLAIAASPLRAEPPRVVTDIAPVHSLASMVLEGVTTPDLLLPPGASPHHYSMRPSEAAALERAGLVIWIGPVLTPWLENPVDTLAGGANRLTLLDLSPVQIEIEGDHHGHGHDHGHDDDHGEGLDPHAWLDPMNASVWVQEISDKLSEIDPENADLYRENAAKARAQIAELQVAMEDRLLALKGRPYAVDHDAYRYLEARFGLEHRFAITDSHADDPGPARIAQLRESVRDAGIQCVLTEGKENSGLIETVIEGHQAKVVKADPTGADLSPGPLLYLDLMHRLSTSMASC